MVGKCDCDEEGNVVRIEINAEDIKVEFDSCCQKIISAECVDPASGKTVTADYLINKNEPHKILIDGQYVAINEFAKYDDVYGEYYDASLEGIIYYEGNDVVDNEWDENGFAWGAFKCVLCENVECPECHYEDGEYYWYIVRIYNPDKDTSRN